MGTQKHDDAPEPQSPERRSPPTVNEIVEELKSLPLNVGYNRLANELFKTGPCPGMQIRGNAGGAIATTHGSSPSSSRSSLSRRRSSCCSR